MATKGFSATSVQDIATALGIQKATLYHHIDSKMQLLLWIIRDYMALGREIVASAEERGSTPRERLEVLIREHVAAMAAHPHEARVVAQDLGSLEGDYWAKAVEERDHYDRYVEALIAAGQESGEIRESLDPHLTALALLSMMNGTHLWYRPSGSWSPPTIAKFYIDFVFCGLAGDSSNGASDQIQGDR